MQFQSLFSIAIDTCITWMRCKKGAGSHYLDSIMLTLEVIWKCSSKSGFCIFDLINI